MTVAINILVVFGNGLSPASTSFELRVVDIDTSIDNIDVNALTTVLVIFITSESGEVECFTVADTRETLCKDVNTKY